MGILVRVFGAILAAIMVVGGVIQSQQMQDQRMLFGGIGGGIILLLFFYILSVFISAQGQMLKASLDSAVNTSPFLEDDHRAQIMSL